MRRTKHLHSALRRTRRLFKRLLGVMDLDQFQVEVACPTSKFGSHYGGWTVCPTRLQADSIVYSFGIGEDLTFDLGLIAAVGLQVHAFDPTPRSIEWARSQALPPKLHLHEVGLADYDGVARFSPPENPEHVSHTILPRTRMADQAIAVRVQRLQTIIRELGHDQIAVLKMDIEGAEYAVLDDLLKSGIVIPQLLVEFHHRFEGVGAARTIQSIEALRKAGYRIFAHEPGADEYSFLHD